MVYVNTMRIFLGVMLALLSPGCASRAPRPSPAAPPAGVVRFLVGGDSRDDTAHVIPWAFGEAKARGAAAFLFLGDMELSPSLDTHFQKELALLAPIPFYPALGNHEVEVFGVLPIEHASLERRFSERFLHTRETPVTSSLEGKVVYAVDLPGGVHFVALDNVSAKGFGADQLTWLAHDLERARGNPAVKFIIVGMHKPLAKNGVTTHAMDADGASAIADSDAALALFIKAKVDLIVASHLHELVEFTQGGIRGYITGGLGAPLAAASGAEQSFHHFLQIDVTSDGLHVTAVRFPGAPSRSVEPDRD
jgi:Calcineurin-like phosphoesterase